MIGKVYLVGAGPGHPGLITLRGVECLRRADAVLYDYLCNPEIVLNASANAELICLGRHRRQDVWPQPAIIEELVRRALQGQTVVRLKGGDPMIFGRATEELKALADHDIPFEIVPGVTAGTAAGAYAGVPITDRLRASAVALVTAQESDGKLRSGLDYQALADFPGTLVFYMGVTTAAEWTRLLIEAGKPADTPALIVRQCSLPDQTVYACRLSEVAERLTPRSLIPPPVVVIVGTVAEQHTAFDWVRQRPLFGVRVLVTRPRHQAANLSDRLADLGAEVILQPAIRIEDPEDWQPVDAALRHLRDYDTVVFSSANGVHFFLKRLLSSDLDLRAFADVRLAVIGPGTADALAQYHLHADVQPHEYRAEALAEALAPTARDRRFLLIRASRGRETLAEELRKAGAQVDQIVVYRSTDTAAADPEIARRLSNGTIDWVTVTSSAIARSLSNSFGDKLSRTRLASLSPVTSATLRQLGFEPEVEAAVYTMPGLVDAILTHKQKAVTDKMQQKNL